MKKKRVALDPFPPKRLRWINPKRFRGRHRHPYMIDFFMAGHETRYCPSCTFKPLVSFPDGSLRCKVCLAKERQPIAPFLAPWTREGHNRELDRILASVGRSRPLVPTQQPITKQPSQRPTQCPAPQTARQASLFDLEQESI